MLASSDAFLAVVVLFWRVVPLFSWMRMVRMSPTAWAFLSENIEVEVLRFQSESARAVPTWITSSNATAEYLQIDENRLFILDLSIEFTPGFRIAQADNLAGQAVLQRFHFQRNTERAVAVDGFDNLAALDDRLEAHRTGQERHPGSDILSDLESCFHGREIHPAIAIREHVTAFEGKVGFVKLLAARERSLRHG